MTFAFFAGGTPGLPEILIILFVVLLLFGAKKLPELSRSLGKSLSEFKKGREEGLRSITEAEETVSLNKAVEAGDAEPESEKSAEESAGDEEKPA